ncbi:MAG: galactose-1-epimerase [Planctomycetes bacterium B3_Pla]|nr:MAG: galactose-1-epimerase [Planctomycetes bacterium B3_Pla]
MKTRAWTSLVLAMVLACMSGCGKKEAAPEESETKPETKETGAMSANEEPFGQTPDGRQVALYTLTNPNGIKARITSFGAILVSLEVPDRDGNLADVTLGFDALDGYLGKHPYFGAIVGRYANRIGKAGFMLNDVEYKLAANNGENHLHGGAKGFDKKVWKLDDLRAEGDEASVKMSYISEDGEEGYPGNLACSITYTLTKDDELKISYEADTDKATVVNLTNHSYFNLGGQGTGDVLGHELMLNADKYTVVDEGLIPTGENRSVKDSPMDFTISASIGSRIAQVEGGYDHNYVLKSGGGSLALCARAYEPTSGRVMEVYTTEPGVQLYTGNFLDDSVTGKGGKVYKKHYGFCLETQHFPDSPNKPDFPSVVLEPGQKYATETVFKFATR